MYDVYLMISSAIHHRLVLGKKIIIKHVFFVVPLSPVNIFSTRLTQYETFICLVELPKIVASLKDVLESMKKGSYSSNSSSSELSQAESSEMVRKHNIIIKSHIHYLSLFVCA